MPWGVASGVLYGVRQRGRKKGLHADLDVTGFGDVTGEFFNVTRENNQDSINALHMYLAPDRGSPLRWQMRSYRATSTTLA